MAFWATCKIAQPIQPIWQHIFALPWSALKKAPWEFNFFHIFGIPSSSRHEKCFQMLQTLFWLFQCSKNPRCWLKKSNLLCPHSIGFEFLHLQFPHFSETCHPVLLVIYYSAHWDLVKWPRPNWLSLGKLKKEIILRYFITKIVLVFEKNFWNSRLKFENLQNFWNHYLFKQSEQFLVT